MANNLNIVSYRSFTRETEGSYMTGNPPHAVVMVTYCCIAGK